MDAVYGPYRVISELGRGGMGIVYLAHDDSDLVALKVISPEKASDSQYQMRFANEVRNAQKVNDPRVARIKRANTTVDPLWFASEFVIGMTIEEAVQMDGPLSYATVGRAAADVATALAAIHARGVVHRDIKPANVMLGPDRACVIDFGIAHSEGDARITTVGNLIGSVAFMCPEQIEGRQPDPAWDVFAFGGMLVYALSGHLPFGDGCNAPNIMRAILDRDPDLTGVDTRIHPLIKACLAKDPKRRPTASDLRNRLSKVVGPPSPGLPLSPSVKAVITTRKAQLPKLERAEVLPPAPVAPSSRPNRQRNQTQVKRKPGNDGVPGWTVYISIVVALGLIISAYEWWPFGADGDQTPSPKPSSTVAAPSIAIPEPSFTVGQLGVTYDPSARASIQVGAAKAVGYTLQLSLTAIGYGDRGKSVLKRSCVRVYRGGDWIAKFDVWLASKVATVTDGNTKGTFGVHLLESGDYVFHPECKDKDIRTVSLGRATVDILGRMSFKNALTQVMAVKRVGKDDLLVTVPRFSDREEAEYCLKVGTKVHRPSLKTVNHLDRAFVELTFKGVSSGVMYTSCGGDTKKPIFNGQGVQVP